MKVDSVVGHFIGLLVMHLTEGPVVPCFAQWVIRSQSAGYHSNNNIAEAKQTSFSSIDFPPTLLLMKQTKKA